MSSKILQLAVGSRDLSHAEKKITVCKAEKIHTIELMNITNSDI